MPGRPCGEALGRATTGVARPHELGSWPAGRLNTPHSARAAAAAAAAATPR